MSIFSNISKLWKARDETTQQTVTLNALLDMLNIDGRAAGNKLSEITYFTCIKVLSETLGKLPLKLLRITPEGGVEEAYEHPLYDIMRYRPNPLTTSTSFWSDSEMARNHTGNSYNAIVGSGRNTVIYHLPTEDVETWMDDKKILSPKQSLWYIYNDKKSAKTFKLHSDSVLHFRTGLSDDGINGLAVQDILKVSLDSGLRAQELENKAFKNGFTAKAVVQYTGQMNPQLEKTFAKGLSEFTMGRVEDTNVIPIPLGASITPLNIKFTDAQFIEIKRYSALQIAAAFGIKPQQINDYEKSSYASAEAQQLAFYVDTLLYILKMYEEELSYKLLSADERAAGLRFKFNVSVILRADLKTQIESLAKAVQNGIYKPNEARGLLDMPKDPDGDRLLCNGNMIPVGMAGTQWNNGGGEENEE